MKKLYTLFIALFAGALFVNAQPPTITGFSPKKGAPGTVVTITGTNFNATAASNVVYFGPVRAIVLSATATTITALSPVSATYNPIKVTNVLGGLTGISKRFFTPTFSPKNTNMAATDFLGRVDFSTPALHPTFVGAGDLSPDGRSDMIATTDFATFNSKNIFIYFNNSITGTIDSFSFPGVSQFPTVTGSVRPQAAAYGDIDLNGVIDLVASSYGSGLIFVRRDNLNEANFILASAAGAGNMDIAICDMDLDGKQDIIVPNALTFGISISKNNSTGSGVSFGGPFNFVTGFQPIAFAIGDLDGDEKEDVALININTDSTAGLSILRNTSTTGSFSFAPVVTFTTGAYPRGIALADIDGDDKLDVVVTNQKRNTISILRNISTSGSINFSPKVNFNTGTKPKAVAVGDLNGDGKVDIVVTNTKNNNISVFQNQAVSGTIDATSLATPFTLNTGSLPVSVAINDLDGDGRPDIEVANYNSSTISVIKNEPAVIGAPSPNIVQSVQDRFEQFLQANENKQNSLNANLYPNPAVNFATLSFNSNNKPVSIGLTDMKGTLLWEKQNVQTNILQVPLNSLAPGMYFVSIKSYMTTVTLKLVKQ